ncbi:MAG: autotransporter domain-containing protein [Endomicrobium sp.]|nr:autotransporter domain-containing protein [Endomicrobium sp.]
MKKLIFFIFLLVSVSFANKNVDAADAIDYSSLNSTIVSAPGNPFISDINLSTASITLEGNLSVISSKTIVFKSSDISGKTIIDGDNAYRGIVANSSSNLSFMNINFQNAYNPSNDGGFLRITASSISFGGSETSFKNGLAYSGGAFAAVGNSSLHFSSAAIFNSNSAIEYGGAFYSNRTVLVFDEETRFINNIAEYSGGAFAADTNSNITFNGYTLFEGNKTIDNNGAGFFAHRSDINFVTSRFENNASFDMGGGFYSVQSNIVFSGSAVFVGNSAKFSGGASAIGSYSDIRFEDNAFFSSNTAVNGGGAIFISTSNLSFAKNTIFEDNVSLLSGGAIAVDHYATVLFNGESYFRNNKTDENGGAIANINAAVILSSASHFENNSAKYGGAIYISSGNLSLSDTVFDGNTASNTGGAIYLAGISALEKAVLTVNTSSETSFINNKAGNVSNALYLGDYSLAEFNTAAQAAVQMHDAISGSGYNSELILSGAGEFNLYNSLDSVDITLAASSAVSFNLKNNARINAGKLTIGDTSTFNMVNNAADTVRVSTADIDGTLSMEILKTGNHDQIISSGKINISSSSSFEITTNITDKAFRKKTYLLINTAESINGVFGSVSITTPTFIYTPLISYGDLFKNWITITLRGDNFITDFASSLSGLSFNQRQTAKTYDSLSSTSSGDLDIVISLIDGMDDNGKKSALAQASGYFLANVIRSIAVDVENNEIYDRIKNHCIYENSENGIWAQLRGAAATYSKDKNSINDFNDISSGVMIGFDRFMEDKKIMLGAYGKYNNHDIKQGSNEAEITNTGLGIYGGLIEKKWEVKALISGGYDSYNTKRYIPFADRKTKAEFDGTTFGADIEGAIKFRIDKYFNIRPYIGVEAKNSHYNGFKERDGESLSLEVHGNSYVRSASRLGSGVVYDNNIFSWHINAEAKYLMSGEAPEIESIFEGSDIIFRSRGSTEGSIIFGAVAGVSIRVTKKLKLFVNGSYYGADHFQNLYGNIGLRWTFCSEKKEKIIKTEKKNSRNNNYDPALYLLSPVPEEPKEMDAIITFEDTTTASTKEDEYDPAIELLAAQKEVQPKEEDEYDPALELLSAQKETQPKEEDEYDAALVLLQLSKEAEQQQPDMEDAKVVEQQQREAALRRSKPMLKSFSLNMANFAVGKAVLTKKAKENIRLQSDEIKKFKFKKITIEGHTDSTGNANLNKKLSRERAKAVFNVFVKEGIPARKMSYIGFSSLLPVATNSTKEGRAQNRRVEIFVE